MASVADKDADSSGRPCGHASAPAGHAQASVVQVWAGAAIGRLLQSAELKGVEGYLEVAWAGFKECFHHACPQVW